MAKLNCGTFELYYEDSGGAGEPVALIHGSWGDHHQWDGAAARIAPTHRVLSYDRRGHGASAASGKPMALAEQVTDLSMLLSVIGRGPVHLVANGTGASIALALALQRPDQVRSVNLHEPPLFGLLAGEAESSAVYQGARAVEDRTVRLLRAEDRAGGAQAFANAASAEPGGWAELPPEVQRSFIENAAAALKELEDPAIQNLDLPRFAAYRDPIVLTGGHGAHRCTPRSGSISTPGSTARSSSRSPVRATSRTSPTRTNSSTSRGSSADTPPGGRPENRIPGDPVGSSKLASCWGVPAGRPIRRTDRLVG